MNDTQFRLLESQVLELPKAERITLTENLLKSLSEEDEVLAAWIEEADRRADALDRGETHTVDAEEVISKARARIRREA